MRIPEIHKPDATDNDRRPRIERGRELAQMPEEDLSEMFAELIGAMLRKGEER